MTLLESYKKALKASHKAQEKVETLRKSLALDCSHPVEFVRSYRWEHDNGYGRQSAMTGKICDICRSKDLWGTGFKSTSTWWTSND